MSFQEKEELWCLGGRNTSHTSTRTRVQLPKLTAGLANTMVDQRISLTQWKGTTNDLRLSSDLFISYTLVYTQLHSHMCKHLYNTPTHTFSFKKKRRKHSEAKVMGRWPLPFDQCKSWKAIESWGRSSCCHLPSCFVGADITGVQHQI